MSTITRMNRYGRVWQILLDCGHILERTQDQIKQQQLYIGRCISCEQCSNP